MGSDLKPVPVVGVYIRENKLDPPVPALFNHNNVEAHVLVLKYIFKEGSIFNEIERPDGTVQEVPNSWLVFERASDKADIQE